MERYGPPLLIVVAGVLAYANSFSGPLVLDDLDSIANNPTIRHWSTAPWPPIGLTTTGRPILNLSLALNYAVSGTAVWSYHGLNLAIHLLAGLTLFGIVRRTLAAWGAPASVTSACAVALLWVLHPLQTEAVTYIIQRAESLMGMFYLLTLYCFIRGAQTDELKGGARCPPRAERPDLGLIVDGANQRIGGNAFHLSPGWWYGLSGAACLLGMGTKEVMATAPLLVLLYDRTFLAGSFTAALRRRGLVYAGLAATWLVLPFLVLAAQGRSGSAGFASGVAWRSYALTQFPAIVHYLRLCVWPHPLVFDYGAALTLDWFTVLPCALVIIGLLAATAWALVRHPAAGFLGAWFFVILAPSSSIIPVATQTVAEQRMYLPLIAVVVGVVLGLQRLPGRAGPAVVLGLAVILGGLTARRNETYRREEDLWSDTVAGRPANERAHNNLAFYLLEAGRDQEGIEHYEQALRLKPDYADAHFNLANVLATFPGRLNEAIGHYEAALRVNPQFFQAQDRLGNALMAAARPAEAAGHYEAALRLNPNLAQTQYSLGNALERMPGRLDEAIAHYEAAVRLKPDLLGAGNSLGNALSAANRVPEAIAQFEQMLRRWPAEAPLHFNLALVLLKAGRTQEAADQLRIVLQLQPDHAQARKLLADLFGAPS
jgi:Tfp pilus assembly protein PilF